MADQSGRFGEFVWAGLEPDNSADGLTRNDPQTATVHQDIVSAVFVGGSGDDAWVGTEDSDTADGNGGSDSLIGNGGNDFLSGGAGADYLDGGTGDDVLFSNNRDPAAFAFISYRAVSDDYGTEVDTLVGGAGDDYIVAGYGDNVDGGTQGSYGNRLYITFRGASSGVSADFRLLQTAGSITIGGGLITNIQNIGFLEGSEFDDFLVPIDTYYPTGGNVYGRGGNDQLIAGYYSGWGGSGLYGGDGDDILDGRPAQYGPVLYGDAGNDTFYGGSAAYGGDGNDTFYSGGTIDGGAGNDTIYLQQSYYSGQVNGGSGDDLFIASGYGSSSVFGDAGNDTFTGGDGIDVFSGGAGNDNMDGGGQSVTGNYAGDVSIYSGNVADYLVTRDNNTGVVTVVDLRGGSPEGTDTLTNVELLKFANGTYTIAAVLSGQATGVMNFVGTANADSYYGSEESNTAIGLGGADTFYGFGGNDVMQGNGGADFLDGGTGDDTLYSGDPAGAFSSPYYGNQWTAPVLDTGTEVDTLIGGDGSDVLFAGYGDNVDGGANGQYGTGDALYISFLGASAGVTADFRQATLVVGGGTITGIENVNWVEGSNFDDDITLGSGNGYSNFTPIFGLGGNDRLVAGYYTGSMWGGDGNDFVDGRLSQYLQSVDGGAGDDTLYTNTNTFAAAYGGDGNDTIYAHGTIDGGAGSDTITVLQSYYAGQVHGGTGDDTITVQQFGHSAIFGDDGNDTINGGLGADTLDGGNGNDTISGGGGANILRGGAGNDRLVVTAADSGTVVEGGADIDTLAVSGAFTLEGASSGIEIVELNAGTLTLTSSQFATSLATNTQLGGTGAIVVTMQPGFAVNGAGFTIAPGANLTLTVNGSILNDTVTGIDGIANVLNGGNGADTLRGGTGGDTIDGGAGANALFGGAGNDRLLVAADGSGTSVDGGADSDTLAVSGAVTLGGLAGIEAVELAAGATLTLTGSQATTGLALASTISGPGALIVNMAVTDLQLSLSSLSAIGGASVTLNGSSSDEVIKGLITSANTINGGGGGDQIRGGALTDTINGGDGDDKIIGANGADVLTGGLGADTFRYQAASHSGVGAAADTITDFLIGTDKLAFAQIDTDPVAPGDQAFAFIGNTAFHATGTAEMRYMNSGANLLVQADINGDGIADMEVVLAGLAGQTLTGASFLL